MTEGPTRYRNLPGVLAGAATAEPLRHVPRSGRRRENIVVVHGLWMSGRDTAVLRRRFEAAGYNAWQFVYPTIHCGLDENAERLAEFAAELPGGQVHFVGHSLGGVLILKAFERFKLERAGRIVCLGSPLKGTHAGRILDSFPLGRRIVGRCIHELVECGGCRPWNGERDLGVIAGDRPYGFARLLGGLEKPHDGTIAVSETQLPGVSDHIVLHVTHMSMLWSPTVAEYTLRFLRNGQFQEELSEAVSS